MMKPEEYRKFAEQCVAWASETKDPEVEEQLLKLAADWLRAESAAQRASEMVAEQPAVTSNLQKRHYR